MQTLSNKQKEQIVDAMAEIEGLGPASWDGDAFAEADWPQPSGMARVWVEVDNSFPGDAKPYRFGVGIWFDLPTMNGETRPERLLPELRRAAEFDEGLAHAIDELRQLLPV